MSRVALLSIPVCVARDTTTLDANAVYIGCSDGKLYVCDLNSPASSAVVEDICLQQMTFAGPVVAIALSDSHIYVSSHSHGEMKIIEKMAGTGLLGVVAHTWRAHSDKIKSILRMDATALWTCADDRFIKVWKLLFQGGSAWVMHQQDLPQQLQKIGRMISIEDAVISAADVITVWHKVRGAGCVVPWLVRSSHAEWHCQEIPSKWNCWEHICGSVTNFGVKLRKRR